MTADARRHDLERWFVRRGVPHLIHDYDPREDVLVRLRPLLVVLFAVGLALVLRPEWPWWGRWGAAFGVTGAAVVLYLAGRRLLGGRVPSRGDRMGFAWAGALVLGPAAVNLALGGDVADSVVIAAEALAVAVVGYALVSLGIVSLLVHLGRAALDGLLETASVAARAMPLMLAVLLFLFVSAEVWETLGTIEGWRFGGVFLSFALLGVAVLFGALRLERRGLTHPACDDATRRAALGTPAAPLVEDGVAPVAPPLTAIQRLNVSVAMLTSLGVRVVAVGAAVGVFFLVFGLLVMTPETTQNWTGQGPGELNVLLDVDTRRGVIVLSEPLVRVSVLLGAFAAVYFAVVAVGDERNRREFVDDEIERLQGIMAAWAYYRGMVTPAADPPAPAP